jgi:psiF repeat
MRLLAIVSTFAMSIVAATAALSQSATPPQSSTTASRVQVNQAAPVPVVPSKRMACVTAARDTRGQEHQDQMQLCMAQAHLDCLKQAIDQKVTGDERKEFVKTCIGL